MRLIFKVVIHSRAGAPLANLVPVQGAQCCSRLRSVAVIGVVKRFTHEGSINLTVVTDA
jgi:hypothetical protein